MSFSDLGLSSALTQAVEAEGYQSPSPIQLQAIPAVLAGHDVLAAAQTGTGKTAGFALPMLQLLSQGKKAQNKSIRALILTPTRELAAQVGASVARYGENTGLREAIVFGGVNIRPQIGRLAQGVDILVATPGRLLDLYGQQAFDFKSLEILVLDEADRMLDMGFIHDIKRIIKLLPAKRQNLMFSATFSDPIRALASSIVNSPVEISVSPKNSTAQNVEQLVYPVDKAQKPALLTHLIKTHDWYQVLVFSRTKHGANRLAQTLEKAEIKAAAIHGNKSQAARTKALASFKSGALQVLVATDIAARGLDISKLPQVVNVDLPNVPEDYVHRIGRTGRAGESGQAISLVSADEAKLLADIERLIKTKIKRVQIDGFEPDHSVPESAPPSRPRAPGGGRGRTSARSGSGGAGQGTDRRGGGRGNGGAAAGRRSDSAGNGGNTRRADSSRSSGGRKPKPPVSGNR